MNSQKHTQKHNKLKVNIRTQTSQTWILPQPKWFSSLEGPSSPGDATKHGSNSKSMDRGQKIQPHNNSTKMSTSLQKANPPRVLLLGDLKGRFLTYWISQKPTLPTTRAFHTEPFVTHPWRGWWLGCMQALPLPSCILLQRICLMCSSKPQMRERLTT